MKLLELIVYFNLKKKIVKHVERRAVTQRVGVLVVTMLFGQGRDGEHINEEPTKTKVGKMVFFHFPSFLSPFPSLSYRGIKLQI